MQIIPSASMADMTCSVNDTASCNVTFTWLYNGSDIMETIMVTRDRYSIIEDGNATTLRIEDLQPADAGVYQCVASGQVDRWILRRTIKLGV